MSTSSAPPVVRAGPRSAGQAPGAVSAQPAERFGRASEVWLPPALLVISWTVGWIASATWMAEDFFRWSLLPTVALLGLRGLLERALGRAGPDTRPVIALYGVHLLLTATALALNPMTCIYAFSGYLDSARFLRGARSRAVVVITAVLMAVGQVGGVRVVIAEVWFFLGLAAVNLLIANGMMFLAEGRERALLAREQALAETLRVQEENVRLHEQLIDVARRNGADEERARLSREIHDTVAQGLVGVIRQLEAVGEDLEPGVRHRLTVAEETARDCLLEARRAVEALGPHQLHDHDLVEALSALVARWARTHRVVATFDGDEAPREGRHGDVLLRITQEALANVARHAGASTVTVALVGDEQRQLLRITDDGRGFEVDRTARGHGLQNMGARLRAVDGRLEVLSAPGCGTTISASVRR